MNILLVLYPVSSDNLVFNSDRRAEERAAYELERSAKEVRFTENFSRVHSSAFFNQIYSRSSMKFNSGRVGRPKEGDGGKKAKARGGGGGLTKIQKI